MDYEKLYNIVYQDQDGMFRKGAHNVIFNIELMKRSLIKCFIIDWSLYNYIYNFVEIVNIIKEFNDDIKDFEHRFMLYPTKYGIFVTFYKYWFFNDNFFKIIKNRLDDHCVSLISKDELVNLTYFTECNPCFENTSSDIKYVLFVEYEDMGSIPFRSLRSKKEAKYLYKYLSKICKDIDSKYIFSVYNIEKDENVYGETRSVNITKENIGLDVAEYNKEIEDLDILYMSNDRKVLYKLLYTMTN